MHIHEMLKKRMKQERPNLGDSDSVLELIFNAYEDQNNTSTEKTKGDFKALYEAMNGKCMEECDQILYPVCSLCWEHEKNGFIHGVKVGMQLYQEVFDNTPQGREKDHDDLTI